jgi:hypothetical protein
VIIKQTPADVCDNCGEYYLSEAATESVLALKKLVTIQHIEK